MLLTRTKQIVTTLLLSSAFFFSAQAKAQDDRQQLIKLVEQQDYQAAFQLAETLFDLLAGDPDFDYIYGLSAFHSGYYQEAIFAFERTLLNRPLDYNARYVLAITYFQVDNYVAAKQEFEVIKTLNIDEKAKQNANQYLAVIEQSILAKQTRLYGNVAFGLGYDSNVNSGLGDELYPIPIPNAGLINFQFPVQSDQHRVLSANIAYEKPLTKPGTLIASASVSKTFYPHAEALEKANVDLSVGYMHKWTDWTARASVFYQKFWFGDAGYQNLYAALAHLNWQFNPTHNFALGTNISLTDNIENDNLDLRSNNFKLSYGYRFTQHKLGLFLSHGNESVQNFNVNSQHFERSINAIGMSWVSAIDDWGVLRAQFQHQSTKHASLNLAILDEDGLNPFFRKKRRDNNNSFQLEFDYIISAQWRWQNSLKVSNRNSNQFFYSFDRNVFNSQFNYSF